MEWIAWMPFVKVFKRDINFIHLSKYVMENKEKLIKSIMKGEELSEEGKK